MEHDDFSKLVHHMHVLGFDILDVPHTPILPEWERYPIIRALRKAEVSINVKYVNPK